MRWVGLLLLLCTSAQAQVRVYNPSSIQFDPPAQLDWDYTAGYIVEWWDSPPTRLLFQSTVPRSSVLDQTVPVVAKAIPFRLLPVPTIGRDYVLRLRAVRTQTNDPYAGQISDPSNYAPQLVRFSQCLDLVTKINQPLSVRYTGPLSIKQGAMLVLTPAQLTITGPNKVTFVSIEALADGAPASYFTMEDARLTPVVLGPYPRRGTFVLEIRAIDERGCEGQHPTPLPRLTVVP